MKTRETYTEMQDRHRKEWNDFPMFFAFNDSQFAEGMKKLGLKPSDTKKIYKLGSSGGFYRKSDATALREMIDRQDVEEKTAIAADANGTGFAFEMFYHELANHEYCVTYDVTEVLDALGYTVDDINNNEQLLKAFLNAEKQYREDTGM